MNNKIPRCLLLRFKQLNSYATRPVDKATVEGKVVKAVEYYERRYDIAIGMAVTTWVLIYVSTLVD